jgi:hypothetical protein
MKNIIILTSSILFLSSCESEQYPIYQYGVHKEVPDSLKDDETKFITETVKASNSNLSAGDPEDVIVECRHTFEDINSVSVEGLNIFDGRGCEFISFAKLDNDQNKIFIKLKNKKP